jgi:hypothetical protein
MVMLIEELPEKEDDPAPEFDMIPICAKEREHTFRHPFLSCQRRNYRSSKNSDSSWDSMRGVVDRATEIDRGRRKTSR